MEYVLPVFKVIGCVAIGYLLLRSDEARVKREWNEAYYCLAFAAVGVLIIH